MGFIPSIARNNLRLSLRLRPERIDFVIKLPFSHFFCNIYSFPFCSISSSISSPWFRLFVNVIATAKASPGVTCYWSINRTQMIAAHLLLFSLFLFFLAVMSTNNKYSLIKNDLLIDAAMYKFSHAILLSLLLKANDNGRMSNEARMNSINVAILRKPI